VSSLTLQYQRSGQRDQASICRDNAEQASSLKAELG
jgi:hypothetical protein